MFMKGGLLYEILSSCYLFVLCIKACNHSFNDIELDVLDPIDEEFARGMFLRHGRFFTCFTDDPCEKATCPNDPTADCFPNFLDTCQPMFFNEMGEVDCGNDDTNRNSGTPAFPGLMECPRPIDTGICSEQCENHGDCRSEMKLCCPTRCGHVCAKPSFIIE